MQYKYDNHHNGLNNYQKNGMMKELMEYDNASLVHALWMCDTEIFNMYI